ncbi:cellulase family glycosylhydrolase [soil metagenome]
MELPSFPYYGFNFLWMYSWGEGRRPSPPDLRQLDFIAERGFNFVRIPTNYWFWTPDFDYGRRDESVLKYLDDYLAAINERGMHMSLNLHRAPGYCINSPELERDNLWTDAVAQEAFVDTWETFARRFRGVPSDRLSFDLLNEPPSVGDRGFTRESHEALMRRTVAAIRAVDPDRMIVLDGLGGGHLAMPELADLGVVHSGRGYQPMPVSHFEAGWWSGYKGLPTPIYPGTVWDGKVWDRDTLREFYEPWRAVQGEGVRVHIGEFGSHNRTPNDVALRWFRDLIAVFREFGWGYALWNFEGSFGIVNHGRPGTRYEEIDGFNVDRELLDILLEGRLAI